MFSSFRNTALAAVAGLALVSPARADVLVDFNDLGVQLEFITPTFETRAATSTFSLDVGGATQFAYNLVSPPQGASICILPDRVNTTENGHGCAFVQIGPLSADHFVLDFTIPTSNPDVYDLGSGGTLTFTPLAAAPEPASLTLLAVGLAGIGMVLRTRRV